LTPDDPNVVSEPSHHNPLKDAIITIEVLTSATTEGIQNWNPRKDNLLAAVLPEIFSFLKNSKHGTLRELTSGTDTSKL
jgi:hypothetical protein